MKSEPCKMFRKKFLLKALCVFICLILVIVYLPVMNNNKNDEYPGKVLPENESKIMKKLFDFDLLAKVIQLNHKPRLLNEAKFSELKDQDLIIVIQVHRRLKYLQSLINSLSNVSFINQTFLIFSHDYYDENINQLIETIDFAKAIQIFFPFSNQIWFQTFPGTSINDCPRDYSKTKALELKCLNAEHPDSYGHYRETKVTQIKHHWWWKLNFIMEHLSYTKQHKGDVVLIEEDHYASPDFVHVWKLMKTAMQNNQNVDILTLGNYEKKLNYQIDSNQSALVQWASNKHNMGFTIDRALWTRMQSCRKEFCTYDDYNWDWSLQFIIDKCLNSKLSTVVVLIPRVYHIGTCGLHHHLDKTCDVQSKTAQLERIFLENRQYLFPETIQIKKQQPKKVRLKNNGGWSDPRDHQLCQQYHMDIMDILKTNSNFQTHKELAQIIKKM